MSGQVKLSFWLNFFLHLWQEKTSPRSFSAELQGRMGSGIVLSNIYRKHDPTYS